jgi:hypothetical protein
MGHSHRCNLAGQKSAELGRATACLLVLVDKADTGSRTWRQRLPLDLRCVICTRGMNIFPWIKANIVTSSIVCFVSGRLFILVCLCRLFAAKERMLGARKKSRGCFWGGHIFTALLGACKAHVFAVVLECQLYAVCAARWSRVRLVQSWPRFGLQVCPIFFFLYTGSSLLFPGWRGILIRLVFQFHHVASRSFLFI